MWMRTMCLDIAMEVIWQGRWRNFYEIFPAPPILCLRKLGLHRIYYIENVGFLWGGRDIGAGDDSWFEEMELLYWTLPRRQPSW